MISHQNNMISDLLGSPSWTLLEPMLYLVLMRYKVIIGAPDDEKVIQKVIDAATEAGAGRIGNYSRCAVINKIKATWTAEEGANPDDGEVGEITSADCVWIETQCSEDKLKEVILAVKKIHPYEEPGIQIIKLEEIDF